jgi:protein subunit release factor B
MIDLNKAIVSVISGDDNPESKYWASKIIQMYSNWSNKKGFKTEINLDKLIVSGNFAYGYLRGESGIHRFVRRSPFDENKRIHSSFVTVFVSSKIDERVKDNLSQVRSYIFDPQTLVKDHITGIERNDPDVVLDGDLNLFIETFLIKKVYRLALGR